MGSIAENPFRSLIGRHLGFLRRALPGTSGRAQKSRERHLFVNYRSPRSSASRIIQNGSHEKANTRFSRRRKTPTPTGRLLRGQMSTSSICEILVGGYMITAVICMSLRHVCSLRAGSLVWVPRIGEARKSVGKARKSSSRQLSVAAPRPNK